MNLKELENKTILMFGKSRAFSDDEFMLQMKLHNIHVVKEYSDEVVLIVDGKMMTPYEDNESVKLYEQKKAEFVDIDTLDRALSNFLDEDTLLMSLKLSHDKDRLKGYLQNGMVSDALFLKLMKMYTWDGDDFFGNDDNRDISAAFISRFYKNIERNHNVQYSSRGFLHLIIQTTDEGLIETVSLLEPLQKSFQADAEDSNYRIITAIATHYRTPKRVLKMLIKNSNSYVRTLIAMREDCDESMQIQLFETDDEEVLRALSYNEKLNINLALKLMKNKEYAKNIAKYINLDNRVFDMLYESSSLELAINNSIRYDMQKKLIDTNNIDIMTALATNKYLHKDIFYELVAKKDENINIAIYRNPSVQKTTLAKAYKNKKYYTSLASNENTPEDILQKLSQSEDTAILLGLAKNPSTPIDVLYQLQLDSRFERSVKENPTFGRHIQTENIGWQE